MTCYVAEWGMDQKRMGHVCLACVSGALLGLIGSLMGLRELIECL